MEFGFESGRADPEVGAEDLPEQRVEPVPGVSEALDERVLPVEPGEEGFGVVASGERVRQFRAEALQHADPQQEVLGLGGPLFQHLGQQIVGDRALPRLELLQIRLRVRGLARGQGAQPQAGRPAPGAVDERAYTGVGQAQTVCGQEGGRLLGGEGEFRVP